MELFDFVATTGEHYRIRMPDAAPGLRSTFIFAFHKSGSTLVNDMLQAYCAEIGVPTFSLFDQAFAQGISTDQIQADAAACLNRVGYIFTGFRHFPNFELDFSNARTFLITRDPRDMLVSLYYSIRTSHSIPAGNSKFRRSRDNALLTGIDEFVLKQSKMYIHVFDRYRDDLAGSLLTIYRYEDVIYRKEEWFTEFLSELGLKTLPQKISAVARLYDMFPEREDETRHVRQVHPGNFKEKLEPYTIVQLNRELADFLTFFGYDT